MKWAHHPNLRKRPHTPAKGRGSVKRATRRAFAASGTEALTSQERQARLSQKCVRKIFLVVFCAGSHSMDDNTLSALRTQLVQLIIKQGDDFFELDQIRYYCSRCLGGRIGVCVE